MNSSWIKLFRELINWEWYSDINTTRLFIHLLLTVNFETKKWKGETIHPGEIITSYSNLAQQAHLSVQTVRTCVSKLKSTGELTIKTSNKFTLIKLNNWIKYQSTNTQTNKQLTNNQQTTNKQLTTTKEYKEGKNDNNILYSTKNKKNGPYKDFDEFQLHDQSITTMRWGKWEDKENKGVKINRDGYPECPPDNN